MLQAEVLCAARGGRFPTDLKRSRTKLFRCVLLKKPKVVCDQDLLRKISVKGKKCSIAGHRWQDNAVQEFD